MLEVENVCVENDFLFQGIIQSYFSYIWIKIDIIYFSLYSLPTDISFLKKLLLWIEISIS